MKRILIILICTTANAEVPKEEAPQKDSRGNELPVLMPKHVDTDGHAASHADLIDALHAASLLFPDDLIEQIECEQEAEEWQRSQRRFRMHVER